MSRPGSAPAPAFVPSSVGAFRFTSLEADWRTGALALGYALDDAHRFTERYAFPVQMFYLINRWRQQDRIRQQDLFSDLVVSDYLIVLGRAPA